MKSFWGVGIFSSSRAAFFPSVLNLNDAYKEIFKNENLTQNLIKLDQDFKKNELVLEVVNFLEKDKKRPICTPFSK